MRSIDQNIETISRNLSAAVVPQSTFRIPQLGDLAGFNIRTTLKNASGETIVANTSIAQMLDRIQIRDVNGIVVLNVTGRQLVRIANQLSAVGDNVFAPATPAGTGLQQYARTMPLSIAMDDLPAFVDITWAAKTALYSTTSGETAVSLAMRGSFTRKADRVAPVRTVRIKASTPPPQAGDNSLGEYLPKGEVVEKLLLLPNDAGANPLADGDISSVRLSQRGFNLIDGASPATRFIPDDVEYRRDGHNDGEINFRIPIFEATEATQINVNLGTLAHYDLVTASRQKQRRG